MLPDSVLQQYQYELESWSRLLYFILQENVYFKNRLSELLNGSSLDGDLAKMEAFNEDFLAQDKIVEFLQDEIKDQCLLVENKLAPLTTVISRQCSLRLEFRKEEELFRTLKEEFTSYLAENFKEVSLDGS